MENIIRVKTIYGDYPSTEMTAIVQKPKVVTSGPWGIVRKAWNFPVAVYENGKLLVVTHRTAYPRVPFGAWSVWAIRYKGKTYTSLVDDIFGYLTITI